MAVSLSRMSRTTGSYCAAIRCKNRWTPTTDKHFFRFPRDHARSDKWVVNIGREDLRRKTPEYRRKCYRVCSDHFADDCFMNDARKRLTWNAVPTLFGANVACPQSRLARIDKKTNDDCCDGDTFNNKLYLTCAAFKCHSRSTDKRPNTELMTWHRFPQDPEIREKWENISRRGAGSDSVLCSKHFRQHDFIGHGAKRVLRKDAIPLSSYLQSVATHREIRRHANSIASKRDNQEKLNNEDKAIGAVFIKPEPLSDTEPMGGCEDGEDGRGSDTIPDGNPTTDFDDALDSDCSDRVAGRSSPSIKAVRCFVNKCSGVVNDLLAVGLPDVTDIVTPEYLIGPQEKEKTFADKSTSTATLYVPPPTDHDYLGRIHRDAKKNLDAANERIMHLLRCLRRARTREIHNKKTIDELIGDMQEKTVIIMELNTKLDLLCGENVYVQKAEQSSWT